MFSIGKTLKNYWLRQGVKLHHGASDSELTAFEAKYSVRLPQDMREYFATVNGFDSSEYWMTDNHVITFLSLDEMKSLSEAWSPEVDNDAASYYVFADYSLNAHVYAIRLSSNSQQDNPVVVAYEDYLVKVANSFSGFVQKYLEKDDAVLAP